MTTKHLIFLSVPGLRTKDVCESRTPTLYRWANQGAICELTPTFPCVTSPVQSTMLTGALPQEHGVIANGFFYRDRREVEFWVAHNSIVNGEHVWDAMRRSHPAYTSAAWHTQNIKGASADFIVTPSPIHEDDGGMKLWCYSKPDGLYQQILDELGHFPLHHYWGPLTNIESTRWILSAASWLIEKHAPNFHWIYVPHLDYASQKFGPDSDQAKAALQELDAELAKFSERVAASSIASDVVFVVAGEYAMTEVSAAVLPNRILREAGLLAVREKEGSEYLDLERSKAFAMVDHQLAHIYVLDDNADTVAKVADLFASVSGIAGVFDGSRRQEIGLDHPRSGEVVLVCDDRHWLAYYWWLEDAAAPPFARTVDIHAKPGYDPLEMFMNPATRQVSLDTSLIKGSHGVPAVGPQHQTALICSATTSAVIAGRGYRDTNVKQICLDILCE